MIPSDSTRLSSAPAMILLCLRIARVLFLDLHFAYCSAHLFVFCYIWDPLFDYFVVVMVLLCLQVVPLIWTVTLNYQQTTALLWYFVEYIWIIYNYLKYLTWIIVWGYYANKQLQLHLINMNQINADKIKIHIYRNKNKLPNELQHTTMKRNPVNRIRAPVSNKVNKSHV